MKMASSYAGAGQNAWSGSESAIMDGFLRGPLSFGQAVLRLRDIGYSQGSADATVADWADRLASTPTIDDHRNAEATP